MDDKYPPTGFCIMRAGLLTHNSGEVLFDDIAADEVMKNYRERDIPLSGDFEFKTLRGRPPMDPDEVSISSFVPVLKFDRQMKRELWAEDVRWTNRAILLLRGRVYRYCVPAFTLDNNNRPTHLLGLALTDDPTDKTLEPLV